MATPPLSQIWLSLPNDITQLILSHLVDSYFLTDPAHVWTRLRHVSAHQKRAVERRFARFWLPRLGITLYGGARHKFEYRLDNADAGSGCDYATFVVDRYTHHPLPGITADAARPGMLTGLYLRSVWGQYDPVGNRIVTVRLGEGFLGGGAKGGYIVNDTHLPGLEMLLGWRIRFRWKDAMDGLLQEERYMKRVGKEMFAAACEAYQASNPPGSSSSASPQGGKSQDHRGLPPLGEQLRIWRERVQYARRLAGVRHRMSKWRLSPSTTTTTEPAPGSSSATAPQPSLAWPQPFDDGVFRRGPHGLERVHAPNIFEVVEVEESVVPLMGVFQEWLETIRREGVKRGKDDGGSPGEEEAGERDGDCQGQGGDGVGQGKREAGVGGGRTHAVEEAGAEIGEEGGGGISDNIIIGLYREEWAIRSWQSRGGEQLEEGTELEREEARERREGTGGRDMILLGDERIRWALPPFW